MTTTHSGFTNPAEIHEAKQIVSATVADAGKIITPSASVNGTAVLRRIVKNDVDNRVVALTDAATIASNADTTDIGTVTLGASRTLGAPSGTPVNGQELIYRVTQDATGGRVLSFNAIFTFQGSLPAPDLAANTTAFYSFRWNSSNSKWEQFVKPVGGTAYTGKTLTRNTVVTPTTAAADATFATAAQYTQLTGIFDAVEVAPSVNFTRDANSVTPLITGVYHAELHLTAKHTINNTIGAFTFAVNGVVSVDRPILINLEATGVRRHCAGHAYVTLTAGQVITFYAICDKTGDLTVIDGRMSLTLINRTA